MSDTTPSVDNTNNDAGFSLRTVLILIGVGIIAFGGFMALIGFSDELGDLNNGRYHAASTSPNGFAGMADLLSRQGRTVDTIRNNETYRGQALTIYTIPTPYSEDELEDVNLNVPVLFVLPKWSVYQNPRVTPPFIRGRAFSVDDINEDLEIFADGVTMSRSEEAETYWRVSPTNPELMEQYLSTAKDEYRIPQWTQPQTIDGDNLVSLLSVDGKTVFGRISDTNIYILADPDLMNNNGIYQLPTARLANDMIAMASYPDDPIYFDLILHGLGTNNNLIKTAFRPPFLSATLCLLATGLLLAWRAFARFGAAQRRGRVFALGKQALTDNTADLIRVTGRQHQMAEPYVNLIRRRAREIIAAPHSLSFKETDKLLDSVSERRKLSVSFSEIKQDSQSVSDVETLLNFANKAHNWLEELSHERI